jgi:hypothetical protein
MALLFVVLSQLAVYTYSQSNYVIARGGRRKKSIFCRAFGFEIMEERTYTFPA